MLTYVIFGVLLLGAILILITHAYKPNIARSWVIAICSAAIAWIASFILRLYLPTDIPLMTWHADTSFADPLALVINYINWPFLVAIISMTVAILLTDTTRVDESVTPYAWLRVLMITALNLISILAANPLTMAISWMLIDMVDILSLLGLSKASELGSKITTAFGIRLLSTFMLVFATALAWRIDPVQISYAQMTNASIYFLMAAGLRLGVLPLNLPFLDTPELRRGSGILFRLMPAASALVLIAQLQQDFLHFDETFSTIIQVLTIIAAFYSALMWMTRQSTFEAQPYWVVALSAFAVQSALNGHPGASRVWGLGLLLSGSLLFLFNPPIRRIVFLPLFGLLGFIGLPYTLAASGWQGLLPEQINFTWIVMVLTHAFLVIGYLRFLLRSESTVTGLEKYARITFPLGLVVLIQTILVLNLTGWPGVLTAGNYLGSGISLFIVLLALFLGWKFGFDAASAKIPEKIPFYRLISLVINSLRKFLGLGWVSTLYRKVFTTLSDLGAFMNQILEGDGGIMWSLVFIVILSIIFLSIGGRS